MITYNEPFFGGTKSQNDIAGVPGRAFQLCGRTFTERWSFLLHTQPRAFLLDDHTCLVPPQNQPVVYLHQITGLPSKKPTSAGIYRITVRNCRAVEFPRRSRCEKWRSKCLFPTQWILVSTAHFSVESPGNSARHSDWRYHPRAADFVEYASDRTDSKSLPS